jgi:hypothetical protein
MRRTLGESDTLSRLTCADSVAPLSEAMLERYIRCSAVIKGDSRRYITSGLTSRIRIYLSGSRAAQRDGVAGIGSSSLTLPNKARLSSRDRPCPSLQAHASLSRTFLAGANRKVQVPRFLAFSNYLPYIRPHISQPWLKALHSKARSSARRA